MYVKVFETIFDGSLYGQFEPTVVFLAMLVIAKREGIVDMTHQAIAARCGYPLKVVERGIAALEQPDPSSRTPDEDGRRIVRLEEHRNWGWRITNYEKYEKIRSAAERREYFRMKRAEYRARDKKAKEFTQFTSSSTCSPPNLHPNLHLQPKEKDKAEEFPSGLDLGAWEAWRTYRTKIGKPLKPVSLAAAQKALAKFGADQMAVVEQSIAQGWTGLFALKYGAKKPYKAPRSTAEILAEEEREQLATH